MPTIYVRWSLGIFLRFGNNLSKYADLLILTDKIGYLHQFTEKALHWIANLFGGNGAPK